MEILILLLLSLGSAVAIGYIGIAFQTVAEKASQTRGFDKIGRWIYLFPVIEAVQRVAAGMLMLNADGQTVISAGIRALGRLVASILQGIVVLILVSGLAWVVWKLIRAFW